MEGSQRERLQVGIRAGEGQFSLCWHVRGKVQDFLS